MKHNALTIASLLLLAVFFGVSSLQARQSTTSDLLLPHFEVDLTGAGVTTFFSVVNSSAEPVLVRMEVFTNWGIQVFGTTVELQGEEVKVVNLTQWMLAGQLPDRTMSPEELEHCQAVLAGRASPSDGLYYSDEVSLGKAVGYVTLRSVSPTRPKVLFGDYFVVDPTQDFAQGELLVDVDRKVELQSLCERHGLRFLQGAGFDQGTEVLIWSRQNGEASADGILPADEKTTADLLVYSQSGELIDQRQVRFNPLEVMTVADLGLSARFGWLDLITDRPTFLALRHSAGNRFSVGLRTVCLSNLGDPIMVGNQGCSPGFWKNLTHSWPLAGFAPGQSVASFFGAASDYTGIGPASLLEALSFGGGAGADGAVRDLLRASVAGMLNAAHPGVSYPGGTARQIASSVNSALASGDLATMLSLASAIDRDNNSVCPLN